jgi:hypothetical protein
MNAKQALRALSKKHEELAYQVARSAADIKLYNTVILGMIKGESPCQWCEDLEECQLKAKAEGKGCDQWLLTFDVDCREEMRKILDGGEGTEDGHPEADGDHHREGRTVFGGYDPLRD